jgi:hypothetical protein
MLKLLVRLLKACRCKVFICCKSKCSLGENDEITIENINVENNINNNYNDEITTSNKITSNI